MLKKHIDDGGLQCSEDLDALRAYVFDDVKVMDNTDECMHELMTRVLSLDKHQETAVAFVEAFDHIMPCTGDWHGGLAMLQSIYTSFYDGFLEPLKIILGWSRIQKDVRSCYYQGSRLVMLVQQMLTRMLAHTFVSSRLDQLLSEFNETTRDLGNKNFLCCLGTTFGEWIRSLHDCDDKWLRCCSLFLSMANDFFTFVDSYRC